MDITLTFERVEEYWEEYPASLLLKQNKQQMNVSIDQALLLIFTHTNLALSSPNMREPFYAHIRPLSCRLSARFPRFRFF